jgi:hypothetical protein
LAHPGIWSSGLELPFRKAIRPIVFLRITITAPLPFAWFRNSLYQGTPKQSMIPKIAWSSVATLQLARKVVSLNWQIGGTTAAG